MVTFFSTKPQCAWLLPFSQPDKVPGARPIDFAVSRSTPNGNPDDVPGAHPIAFVASRNVPEWQSSLLSALIIRAKAAKTLAGLLKVPHSVCAAAPQMPSSTHIIGVIVADAVTIHILLDTISFLIPVAILNLSC
jgi:hypothetical protein